MDKHIVTVRENEHKADKLERDMKRLTAGK